MTAKTERQAPARGPRETAPVDLFLQRAYEYDVKDPRAGRSDFTGVALAPCAIDTARSPVPILG